MMPGNMQHAAQQHASTPGSTGRSMEGARHAQFLLAHLGGGVELLDLLLQHLEGFRLLFGDHGDRVEEESLGLVVLAQL